MIRFLMLLSVLILASRAGAQAVSEAPGTMSAPSPVLQKTKIDHKDLEAPAPPGYITGQEYLGDQGIKPDQGANTGRISSLQSAGTSTVQLKVITESDFSQLFLLQGGAFTPRAMQVSNGDYTYNYDQAALNSYLVQAGWAVRLFTLLGGWHFEANLGYSSFTGDASSNVQGGTNDESLRLNLLSLDTRLMYSMEWFPWKRLIPFVDGGYISSFYMQTGLSDLEAAQGSVGEPAAGAGLRFWLNRGSFTGDDFVAKFSSTPIFLTAKVNWIGSSGQSVDLGSRSYIAGIAVGL